MTARVPWNSIPALVRDAAARFGTAEALVDGDTRLTFEQLAAEAGAVARAAMAAGLEPGDQAVLQAGQLFWLAVTRDHDLLVRQLQRVERMEERLLGLFGPLQELDVVDQQQIDVAVAPLEGLHVIHPDGVDEVVGELFTRDIAHPHGRFQPATVGTDRVQQVGLAEARRPVQHEGVVGLAGQLGDRQRRGVREAVAVADDELIEAVARVERGECDRRLGAVGVLAYMLARS